MFDYISIYLSRSVPNFNVSFCYVLLINQRMVLGSSDISLHSVVFSNKYFHVCEFSIEPDLEFERLLKV